MFTPAIHNQLISWASQEGNLQRVAYYINIILVILLAASLAHFTWQWVPVPAQTALKPSPQVSQNFNSGANSSPDISTKVSSFHLFGQAVTKASRPTPRPSTVQRDAKPTKLNLKLKGVLFTSLQSSALAIIADAKKEEKHYSVGDSLPMGAELVEIHADRIILSYRGQFESLRLETETGGAAAPRGQRRSNANANRVDNRNRRDLSNLLKDYRTALVENPAALADLIQITPATNGGQFSGFTLNPGRDRDLFRKFGFRSGDVVTSVNGVSLDDPMKGMQVFNSLSMTSELDITVMRNGQEVSLSFEVGQ